MFASFFLLRLAIACDACAPGESTEQQFCCDTLDASALRRHVVAAAGGGGDLAIDRSRRRAGEGIEGPIWKGGEVEGWSIMRGLDGRLI